MTQTTPQQKKTNQILWWLFILGLWAIVITKIGNFSDPDINLGFKTIAIIITLYTLYKDTGSNLIIGFALTISLLILSISKVLIFENNSEIGILIAIGFSTYIIYKKYSTRPKK